MFTRDYQYRAAWCKYCNEGWVEIVQEESSKRLFFCCDECENEWTIFGDISKYNTATHDQFGPVEEPTYQEIKYKGWEKYLIECKAKLSGFIGIGLIYDGKAEVSLIPTLTLLINYLIRLDARITEIVYSEKPDGLDLIRRPILNNSIEDVYTILAQNFHQNIQLKCKLFDLSELDITIRIKTFDDYYGLLLDIPQTQIFTVLSGNVRALELRTEKIIEFMKEIFKETNFSYAVCDTETEIKYAPKVFKELIDMKLYSVAMMPDESSTDKSLKIVKGERHINIISARAV